MVSILNDSGRFKATVKHCRREYFQCKSECGKIAKEYRIIPISWLMISHSTRFQFKRLRVVQSYSFTNPYRSARQTVIRQIFSYSSIAQRNIFENKCVRRSLLVSYYLYCALASKSRYVSIFRPGQSVWFFEFLLPKVFSRILSETHSQVSRFRTSGEKNNFPVYNVGKYVFDFFPPQILDCILENKSNGPE